MTKVRKPRFLKNSSTLYPRIEVEKRGVIWIQVLPHGKWKKIPYVRAQYIVARLHLAIKYSEQQRERFGWQS